MAFPKTLAEMAPMGFTQDNDSTCKSCGDEIEWWITPQGKSIPMNKMYRDGDPAIAHWSTCSSPERFRKPKP